MQIKKDRLRIRRRKLVTDRDHYRRTIDLLCDLEMYAKDNLNDHEPSVRRWSRNTIRDCQDTTIWLRERYEQEV